MENIPCQHSGAGFAGPGKKKLRPVTLRVVPSQKRPYHHGSLAPVLKKAALRLIAKNGVAGFSLRDAARAAGVSHAAPYRHFRDRDSLLATIAEDGFRGLHSSLVSAREKAGDDSLAGFLLLGAAFVDYAISHPSHFRVMYGPQSPSRSDFPEIHRLDLACREEAAVALEEAQKAGQIREGDPRELSVIAFAMLYGATGSFLDGQLKRLGFNRAESRTLLQRAGLIVLEGFLPR